MEFCNMLEPGLPLSPGALGQDDKQQLLWGYPGILWASVTITGGGESVSNDILIIFDD